MNKLRTPFSVVQNMAGERGLAPLLPVPLPVEKMDEFLNPAALKLNWQRYEAEATHGRGVFDTLKAISKLVISRL